MRGEAGQDQMLGSTNVYEMDKGGPMKVLQVPPGSQ